MIALSEVDAVEVTILMDNSIDLLMASTDVAKRLPLRPDTFNRPLPIAEHGFSALIDVRQADKRARVLFDTGVSRKGVLYNMDAIEINVADIEAIILSHGHADHAMGLPGLIDRTGTRGLPLVLHPDAYLERKLVLPNGMEIKIPPPNKADFLRENIEVIEQPGPSMLIKDMVLVSGEIDRTSAFEKGFPIHYAKRSGVWESDPLIMDDQCAIMNVRGKGLAIITGCGHSGIINTIRYAQKLTGITMIHAVVGGFHLSGALFEPIIAPTITALRELNPHHVMPGHCTGWKAIHEMARSMPEAFLASSVGTTLVL
jgi:7,8-dihydropterin-6-yl-methyl-4-(beta-D-ribofuranosyl)aminobenzene 5'-phosphate synthase